MLFLKDFIKDAYSFVQETVLEQTNKQKKYNQVDRRSSSCLALYLAPAVSTQKPARTHIFDIGLEKSTYYK